jgi:hypothetical protein
MSFTYLHDAGHDDPIPPQPSKPDDGGSSGYSIGAILFFTSAFLAISLVVGGYGVWYWRQVRQHRAYMALASDLREQDLDFEGGQPLRTMFNAPEGYDNDILY